MKSNEKMLENQNNSDNSRINGLNIGCGSDIRNGYVNLDIIPLPGVDVVWDIKNFPYPFPDNRFSSILLINVLEHLPDTISTLEELYRLSTNKGKLMIRVPYWNSLEQSTDPTHVKIFNERSLDYFDPSKPLCKRRPYYSNARFSIDSVGVWLSVFGKYILIHDSLVSKILLEISHYISNVVKLIEFTLEPIKPFEE